MVKFSHTSTHTRTHRRLTRSSPVRLRFGMLNASSAAAVVCQRSRRRRRLSHAFLMIAAPLPSSSSLHMGKVWLAHSILNAYFKRSLRYVASCPVKVHSAARWRPSRQESIGKVSQQSNHPIAKNNNWCVRSEIVELRLQRLRRSSITPTLVQLMESWWKFNRTRQWHVARFSRLQRASVCVCAPVSQSVRFII